MFTTPRSIPALSAALVAVMLTGCGSAAPAGLGDTLARHVVQPTSAVTRPAAPAGVVAPSVTLAAGDRDDATQTEALDQDLGDYGNLGTLGNGYQVMGLGAFATRARGIWVKIKPGALAALLAHHQVLQIGLRHRLEARPELRNVERQLASLSWVDNGDGTKSKHGTISVDRTVNGRTCKRTVQLSVTVNATTHVLQSAHAILDETLPNGTVNHATRDNVLQEDGSYLVTLHAESTYPRGARRVADVTRTIGTDGHTVGKRHVVWTDASGKVTRDVTTTVDRQDEAPEPLESDSPAPEASPTDVPSTGPSPSVAPVADPAPSADPSPATSPSADAGASASAAADNAATSAS